MKKVLIVGGTSAIASATALNFAKNGADLFLADINESRLNEVKTHITALTQAKVNIGEYALADVHCHKKLFDRAFEAMGEIDAVLIAHGTLPEQEKIQNSSEEVVNQLNINFISVVSLATIAAEYFEKKSSGCIAVISSVAGDRGRKSNYIYGSAKGGVSIFFQGLRNRLSTKNINVLTIKPGFVDTPMTAHLPKNPLYASAEAVGKAIWDAMKNGRDVVYVPWFWRWIMLFIKMLPESIFKKLSL